MSEISTAMHQCQKSRIRHILELNIHIDKTRYLWPAKKEITISKLNFSWYDFYSCEKQCLIFRDKFVDYCITRHVKQTQYRNEERENWNFVSRNWIKLHTIPNTNDYVPFALFYNVHIVHWLTVSSQPNRMQPYNLTASRNGILKYFKSTSTRFLPEHLEQRRWAMYYSRTIHFTQMLDKLSWWSQWLFIRTSVYEH